MIFQSKTGCEQVKGDSQVPGKEEMALLATKTGQAARGAGWGVEGKRVVSIWF